MTRNLAAPVACRSPQPAARIRLVCFPHSGGGPMTFRSWPGGLAPDVEVWNVTLPGRAGRRREPFAREWGPLVAEFTEAIVDDIAEPVALFGHSLGAVLAFEVARALTREGLPPEKLIVSARESPDTPQRWGVPDTDDELLRQIDRLYGGIPDAVREAPEIMDHYLPVLRADLELITGYRYDPGPALRCPVTAMAGADDPTVAADRLALWREQTVGRFDSVRFAGGHFYLADNEKSVLDVVAERLGR
jgi:medium-chain acyl-[acyl-carrier-protein] hydrolase